MHFTRVWKMIAIKSLKFFQKEESHLSNLFRIDTFFKREFKKDFPDLEIEMI
jgi:hypothetical protein